MPTTSNQTPVQTPAPTTNDSHAPSAQTRRRLLEAAGEVFARRGFREATVREICQLAHANLAAVGYHFRDKQGLYEAVLDDAHACAPEPTQAELQRIDAMPPDEALRVFINAFVHKLLDSGKPAYLEHIMAREMAEPTPALAHLVQTSIRPSVDQLSHILRAMLGPGADEDLLWRCGCSIYGQCLFYVHSRPVLQRLEPNRGYGPTETQQIAQHVYEFSLAALQTHRRRLSKKAGAAAGKETKRGAKR
jgi:TetR/AcrR family transcriptional regulator, regulator of cefoperazone and chloramphenicol sensitivity